MESRRKAEEIERARQAELDRIAAEELQVRVNLIEIYYYFVICKSK